MGLFFSDPLHDELGGWPLGYIPYGGADLGEVQAVGREVGTGDDGAFHDAWAAAGERLWTAGAEAEADGGRISAQESYLRAATFFGTAYHPLFGSPVDPRLTRSFGRQTAALEKALMLRDPPGQPLRIPFDGIDLPAWLVPAEGRGDEVRPLLILTNGYDATILDSWLATGVAATRRGYHVLIFDGPGQGGALYVHGRPLRPDWETVVRAVVDVAVTHPLVDARRIALSGWSLGGYLAPRAASGEPRLAALIADPGLWSIAEPVPGFAAALGIPPEAVADLHAVPDAAIETMERAIAADRRLSWSFVRRGYWVHGVGNLRDYLTAILPFTLDGCAEAIRCPTLVTAAESDVRAVSAERVFAALPGQKTLIRFTAAEGAGGHCEMMNRSLLNRRVLDWLDATLA